jgi:protein-L-isoaspartate(D-aspartate) O-methyltransferase
MSLTTWLTAATPRASALTTVAAKPQSRRMTEPQTVSASEKRSTMGWIIKGLRRSGRDLSASKVVGFLAALIFTTSAVSVRADELRYLVEREQMVRTVESHAVAATRALGRDHIMPNVLRVMRTVPRHEFVPTNLRDEAYADRPVPIGYGQTISQPFIVALMTDLLNIQPIDVVLEIGTGSGYQAAVLAHLARQVYSIEIIPGLVESAADRLQRLGYSNVSTRLGDGYYGWAEAAPFDAIIVTAAASHIPPPLIGQLRPGGRMVIPVGASFALQYLVLVEVDAEGRTKTRQLLPVRFVPLTGQR